MSINDFIPIILVAIVIGVFVSLSPISLNLLVYPKMGVKTRTEKAESLRRVIQGDRLLRIRYSVVEVLAAMSIMSWLVWVSSTFQGFWTFVVLSLPPVLLIRDVFFHLLVVPVIMRIVKDAELGAAPNGGPATQCGNVDVTEGPPSVS